MLRNQGLPSVLSTSPEERCSFDGKQRLVHAHHRRDAAPDQLQRVGLRHAFHEGGEDRRPRTGVAGSLDEGLVADPPVRVDAAIPPRQVHDDEAEIEAALQHLGEGRLQAIGLCPVEGVVVERVGDRDDGVRGGTDARHVLWREGAEVHVLVLGRVRHQQRLSARAGEGHDGLAGQGAMNMQQLQGLEKHRQRVHTRHADALEKGVHHAIGPGERACVRQGELSPLRGTAGLQCHDRHTSHASARGSARELRNVRDAFHQEPDGRDPARLGHGLDDIGEIHLGLVAERGEIGDGNAALVHGHVDGDVAGLHEDGDATLRPLSAMLVRPEQGPIHIVDEAIAVGPEEGHAPSGCNEALLQLGPLLARLLEARRKADRTTCSARRKLAHGLNGKVSVDSNEGRVGRGRQLGNGAVAAPAVHLGLGRMHGPHLAGKAHAPALLDNALGPGTAEHGDGAWGKQAGKGHGRARRAQAGDGPDVDGGRGRGLSTPDTP